MGRNLIMDPHVILSLTFPFTSATHSYDSNSIAFVMALECNPGGTVMFQIVLLQH